MMRQMVPARVDDIDLLVEVVPVPGSQPVSGKLDEAGRKVVEAFDRAQGAIVAIATRVAGTAGELTERAMSPDKLEVQFGLSFTAQGGVVVAGASAEASLQVTISYERKG